MTRTVKPLFGLTLAASAMALAAAAPVAAEGTLAEAITAGKPIVESRLRYEGVDQVGLPAGTAVTWRNRIGWQSDDFNSLKFLVEFEDVRALQEQYNSNTNGKTAYPVVADPVVTELNRAQIVWTPSAYTTITVGRQRMILDDARFIGNVGWRQDEQTFDALRLDKTVGPVTLTYAYVGKVNRILAETADWDSDSHILNATWPISEGLKLQVFDYALDFKNSKANSTNTYGLRATGATWVSSFKLGYALQHARQEDLGSNPADFDLSETMLEGTMTWDMFTFKVNQETLQGNGVRGFTTPLGTVHAFQGWSDVFASAGNKTHPDGISNLSLGLTVAGYTHPSLPMFKNPTLVIVHHDFDTQRTGLAIGSEWDVQATAGLTKELSLLIKYADFKRASAAMPQSRRKLWVGFEYKL